MVRGDLTCSSFVLLLVTLEAVPDVSDSYVLMHHQSSSDIVSPVS